MKQTNTHWLTKGDFELLDDGLSLSSLPNTDFFVNPLNGNVINNAVFRYQEVKGDFIYKARVSCNFANNFDAPILMAYENDKSWIKICFEQTDQGRPAIVSVVTRDRSDDAVGEYVKQEEVWLLLARKDNTFSAHYSLDGKLYLMTRLAWVPMDQKIKLGFGVQSPAGGSVTAYFRDMSLKQSTPSDLRNLNSSDLTDNPVYYSE